ncbi:MAG: aminomethyl-transferring glycine dehydrogenase subunit GcvPA [Candidatus Methylacidiphilales bacterium]
MTPHDSLLTGYNVHTRTDRQAILQAIGLEEMEDLFSQIPPTVRLQRPLDLPGPMTEWELSRYFHNLADRNATTRTHLSFLGGGAYCHYIPATVDAIASRGEYLTAYTPYQPEMSQGLLRVLHDFQHLVSGLLGLPATNCSVYDGTTAMAEAAWMACVHRKTFAIAASSAILPQNREVLETYLGGRNVSIQWVPDDALTGETDLDALREVLTSRPAAFLVQTPNRFGVLEPIRRITALCREHEVLSSVAVYPMILGCLQSPGSQGADLVTAEAQPLGLPLNAGGPYLGLIACQPDLEPLLPGRIVGECSDLKGEPALALVKEEREQHVSRDKATSHICSNQSLLALRASVYLATLGARGFAHVSALCVEKAHALADTLTSLPEVRLAKSGRFFNEFLLDLPKPAASVLASLHTQGIFGGLDFSAHAPDSGRPHQLLVAVTELHTRADLERMASAFHHALTS